MKLDKTKLNFIAFCGFVSLIAILSFVGFIVFYLVVITKGFSNFNFAKFFNDNKLPIIIVLSVFVLFDIVSTISIWAIKWKCDWSNSSKMIYGILNIILPFLIPFIFAGVAKAKIKEEREEEMREMIRNSSLPPNISGYIDPYIQNNMRIGNIPNNNPNHLIQGTNYYLNERPVFSQKPTNELHHPYNYVVIDSNNKNAYEIQYQEKNSK